MRKKIKLANQCPTVKELDNLARKVMRKKYDRCQVCKSENYLQVAHFITRSNYAVRWDIGANLYMLCSGCHTMRRNSWHKDPASAVEFVRGELGERGYRGLRMRAATIGQKIDKQAVRIYLEAELKKLEVEK